MRTRLFSGLMIWTLLSWVGRAQPGVRVATGPAQQTAKLNPCRQVKFEGMVSEGHSFRRSMGGGLDFLLEAVPHGWIIRMLPSSGTRPEQDFAEVATPPFHSINPLLLTTDFGFRAQDVIGWNPRKFRYLSTPRDFAEAQRAYRAVTSSKAPTREQEMAVTEVAMRALEGQLEVLDAELVPGTADQAVSARLLASHFATTPHTITTARNGEAAPLGKLVSVRFQVRISKAGRGGCNASTNSLRNR